MATNRTEFLHFRATPEEKAAIKANAGHAEVALSTWMRARSLSYGEGDFERTLEKLAPTQPAVEESEADKAMWRSIRGESYEQFMERRVGELLGDDATLAANDRATETAEHEWREAQDGVA